MLLIGKISGQVTEQTLEIKWNISCKLYAILRSDFISGKLRALHFHKKII